MVKKVIVIPEDSPYVKVSKEHARHKFIAQGAVSEASTSLSGSFIVAFAKDIGSNALHIGFLSAFSGILSPFGNLWGSKLMEKNSRRYIHYKFTILLALTWLPILALIFFFWKGIGLNYLPHALIVFYCLYAFLSSVKDPPTFSWLGDLVPAEIRGKYFAQRSRFIGFVGLALFLVAGFVLDFFETKGLILIGYGILFTISIILRLYSARQVNHIFSPRFVLHKGYYFSFLSFIKRYDNFGKFAMFYAVFNFSLMVASPFFGYYMLNDLGFGKVTFTIVSLSSTAFSLLFMPLAGKFSDKYGNLKLMYIGCAMFSINPVIWIFFKSPVVLSILPGFVAGVANAAIGIAVTNYTYDSTSEQKRALCVSYFGLLTGVGVFLGSLLGGFMIENLSISFMNTTLFVFAIAAVLRAGTSLYFLPQLEEVRHVKRIHGLSLNVLHPFRAVHSDITWFKRFYRER
ncbi:MAG: MFS transporter [Nanoarchaeota archaeon]